VSASPDVPSLHRRASALAPLLQARARRRDGRPRAGAAPPVAPRAPRRTPPTMRAPTERVRSGSPAQRPFAWQWRRRGRGAGRAQALAALQPGVMLPLSEGYCAAANARLSRELRAATAELRRAAAARLAAAPPEPDIIKGSRRVRLPAGSPLAGKGLSLRAAAARRRR